MDKIREIYEVAGRLCDDALKAELPGYAERLLHAAAELEKRALELEQQCASEPGTRLSIFANS